MARSGSPRNAKINGQGYTVVSDADINQTPSKEVETIRHSGGNSPKVTEAPQGAEGIKLKLTLAQWETLDELSGEEGQNLSIEYQDGAVATSPGYISVGNWTSADAVCEVMFVPENRWNFFPAA